MSLRASILALVLGLAPIPALVAGTASAQSTPPPSQVPTEARVVAMLSGVEDVPGVETWRAMGPGLVPVLARIVDDAQRPGFVRLRAVQVAGVFTTDAAKSLLRRAVRGRDPLMAREAAIAMARAFGRDAIADVAPLLEHADTAVREGAIRALGSIDDDGARSRLRARLARERDTVLREQIETVLSGGVGAPRDG